MTNTMNYTSYFARLRRGLPENHVPVSIALWGPKDFPHILRFPALAPTKSILTEYKNNGGDWDRYQKRYEREVLSKLDPQRVLNGLNTLTGGRPFILCCFEGAKDRRRCHRSLVADWINDGMRGTPGWRDIVELP